MNSVVQKATKAMEKSKSVETSLEGIVLKSEGNLKNFKSTSLKIEDDGTIRLMELAVSYRFLFKFSRKKMKKP